jgi:hypothetical protein
MLLSSPLLGVRPAGLLDVAVVLALHFGSGLAFSVAVAMVVGATVALLGSATTEALRVRFGACFGLSSGRAASALRFLVIDLFATMSVEVVTVLFGATMAEALRVFHVRFDGCCEPSSGSAFCALRLRVVVVV